MRAVLFFFSLLPRRFGRTAGRVLGGLLYKIGIRRDVVLSNLETAFPEKSVPEREALAKDCFSHFIEVIVDTADLPEWSEQYIRERIAIENKELLEEAFSKGKGVVIATGHIGALEMGPVRLAVDGYTVTSVYQGVRNPYVEDYISRKRSVFGSKVARKGMGLRDAVKALDRGEVVIILGDQDGGKRGAFVPFFGKTASTLKGPADLALRTGAPMITGYLIREKDGYRMFGTKRIPHSDVETMMAEYNSDLEAVIRRYPDQYFWLHKRWKTQPPNPS